MTSPLTRALALADTLQAMAMTYSETGATSAANDLRSAIRDIASPDEEPDHRCPGEWVGGSGGHRKFTGGCSRRADYEEIDGQHSFCERHVPRVSPWRSPDTAPVSKPIRLLVERRGRGRKVVDAKLIDGYWERIDASGRSIETLSDYWTALAWKPADPTTLPPD